MRVIRPMIFLLIFSFVAFAQDATKTLPQAYKLQFENEWVRITRVHYAPHVKLPAHEHTLTSSAYVYLNDSGPVVFNHVDKEYGAITRPPTKAGSFRLYRGVREHHEVENQSDLPSDFLRVEFKTITLDEKDLKGRYFREPYPAGQNFEKVQFENSQVRITRMVCAAGRKLQIDNKPAQPALLIELTPAQLKIMRGGADAMPVTLAVGDTKWLLSGDHDQIENTGNAPAEMLRFDFKTRPLSY